MIISLYGRQIEIHRGKRGWDVFYCGDEGKKRPAKDIVVPATTRESELIAYLSDIYHEYATQRHPEVKIIG